jgi:hypothetical protein
MIPIYLEVQDGTTKIYYFIISSKAFSCDFTYLESKIPPETFEMCIYKHIKTVIANSEPEIDANTKTFTWNSSIVVIYTRSMSKTRLSLSDILCKWQNITRTEPVLFRTQWRTGLTPAPNPVSA